jgi:hypothetical protein
MPYLFCSRNPGRFAIGSAQPQYPIAQRDGASGHLGPDEEAR